MCDPNHPAEGVLQATHALVRWMGRHVFSATPKGVSRAEGIAQEVKRLCRRVADARLGLVDRQTSLRKNAPRFRQRSGGVRPAQDHEVIGIAPNAAAETKDVAAPSPCLQGPAHVDVGQKWREDPALCGTPTADTSTCGCALVTRLFDRRLEPHLDQMQNRAIGHPTRDRTDQFRVWDRVEVLRQISIHYMEMPGLQSLVHRANRVLSAPPRAIDVCVVREVRLIAPRPGRPLPGQGLHLLEQRTLSRHTWAGTPLRHVRGPSEDGMGLHPGGSLRCSVLSRRMTLFARPPENPLNTVCIPYPN